MKKEWVFREILFNALEKDNFFLSQKAIAEKCNISLGNVNYAIKPLFEMNAVEGKQMGFAVIDPKKILLYWASLRKLRREIIFKTFANLPVQEIEKNMPPCLFTAYSGFKHLFKAIPAEYNEVFVYSEKEPIEERFPLNSKKEANIFALKPDEHLLLFKKIPLGQLFVDLWNLDKWYARDFLNSLEEKIDGILERHGYR